MAAYAYDLANAFTRSTPRVPVLQASMSTCERPPAVGGRGKTDIANALRLWISRRPDVSENQAKRKRTFGLFIIICHCEDARGFSDETCTALRSVQCRWSQSSR